MSVIVNASTSTGLGITSDNSGSIVLQNNGATKLTVDSTGSYGTVTTGTVQATTSGTSIDFTGIPSWVKKITIMFNEVSTNYVGSANLLIQIGAGSVDTTGYISSFGVISGAAAASGSSTAGFISSLNATGNVNSGLLILTTIGSNIWIASGTIKRDTTSINMIAGSKTTSGSLDRVRITTTNGTDAFDAGSVNILYEG